MREIGVEHFKVEKICEADEGELEKLEIYYIIVITMVTLHEN